MIHIYSFLDGETKWSADAPTDCDLASVEDGQLEVLRVSEESWLEGVVVETVTGAGIWEAATEADYVMTHGQEWHE